MENKYIESFWMLLCLHRCFDWNFQFIIIDGGILQFRLWNCSMHINNTHLHLFYENEWKASSECSNQIVKTKTKSISGYILSQIFLSAIFLHLKRDFFSLPSWNNIHNLFVLCDLFLFQFEISLNRTLFFCETELFSNYELKSIRAKLLYIQSIITVNGKEKVCKIRKRKTFSFVYE